MRKTDSLVVELVESAWGGKPNNAVGNENISPRNRINGSVRMAGAFHADVNNDGIYKRQVAWRITIVKQECTSRFPPGFPAIAGLRAF
jgi:hypothetical protein